MRFASKLLLVLALSLGLAACKSSEERAEAYYQSGLELREAGDLDRAAVEFRNVFRFDNAHKAARTNLAEILFEQGKTNAAYGQYLRLSEQYPQDAELRLQLAELAVSLRSWDELQRHGPAAIEAMPDDPRARAIAAVMDYFEATEADDAEARSSAVAEAEELLADNPELDVARQIVIAGSIQAQDFERALAALDIALERNPEDMAFYDAKMRVLATLDRPDEAEAVLREMYTRFPEDEDVLQTLIAWYVQRDNLGAVEEVLRTEAGPATGAVEDHVTLVRFIAETEGPAAAREELARLREANTEAPEKIDRYTALEAGIALQMGETDAAIEMLRARLETGAETESTPLIKTLLAQILTETGNPVGARALVEEVLEEDPSNVPALKMQASWLIEAEKPNEAIQVLRTALDQAPRDPEILTRMAEAHERSGAPQLAGERLSLAVEASGNGVTESLRYATFLERQDRFGAARDVIESALGSHPQDTNLLVHRAELALRADDENLLRETIARLEQIGDAASSDAATQFSAALLLRQERLDEGIALLESRVSDTETDTDAILAVVRTRIASGQLEEARSYLDARLEEAPNNAGLALIDAALLTAEGEIETAVQRLQAVVEEYPQAEAPVQQLYSLLRGDGQMEEASTVLAEGLDRMPQSHTLNLLQASEFEADGDLQAALAIYETLYERNSSDSIVANNFASLLTNLRDDPESLERAAAVARRLQGTDVPAFQDTYGWILSLQGNHEDALEYLEPAARALTEDAMVQYHLGMTYAELGRTEEATTKLKRAIELADERPLPQLEIARQTLDSF